MSLIASQDAILADTGPFCRLAEAGEVQLDVAAEFLRDKVQIVLDVHRELRRRSTIPKHGRLTRLELLEVPAGDPIEITDKNVLSRIETIVKGRRELKPGHELEDLGEVATALVAAELEAPALMDDGFGKRLAAQEGVEVFTTQDLAVELTARELLKALYGWGLYRLVYSDATRAEFNARVEDVRIDIASKG